MERRPTVITGIGLVTPLGLGRRENWEGFCAGRSGIAPVRGFDGSALPVRIAGQVPDAPLESCLRERFPKALLKRTARFAHLCLAASRLAVEDAGLDLERENRDRIAVVVGNQGYGLKVIDDEIARVMAKRPDMRPADWWNLELDPMCVLRMMGNSCAAQVSIHYGLTGPSFTLGMSCASGAAAVCAADDLLQLGRADVVLVGGTDALISPFTLIGFAKLEALSRRSDEPTRASRSFDRQRDGFVLAEGAGMLVLETAEHARRRRAESYARLLGHATTSEAYHLTAPADGGAGMAKTMTRALAAARVDPDDVDYVSAHAPSSPVADRAEAQAIHRVFNGHGRRLWVSAQKSMVGHTMAAAGAIEVAVSALTVKESIVTPTINHDEPDPDCDLDVVANVARERRVGVALSNSFGVGGYNCTVVLGAEGGR